MSRVDEVTLRLAAIHDELLALPTGPSRRRYELLQERDALREEADTFVHDTDAGRSTEELLAELAALKRRRAAIIGSRSGYAMGKGGNNAGAASGAWVKLAGDSNAVSGVDRLNVRIAHIEDVVGARRTSERTT